MRALESSQGRDATRPHRPAAFRSADGGLRGPVTPELVLRLQRSAGNAAVASAITVQRKKQQEIEQGTINGILTLDGKDHSLTSLNITDGWIA